MIRLENIGVAFIGAKESVEAVRDVSLTIDKGEIFGIVGASGAGKSTLLRVINLLQRPTTGRVLIDGEDIAGFTGKALRDVRLEIGMIFQHFNLIHTKTVFENVAFALKVAAVDKPTILAKVPEILELVGLSDKADAYPAQLSGGQKQRVGIARALVNSPKVLLCDEPTSALDLETTNSILDLLREINRKTGITMVLITHEMAVVKKICDRVAVMSEGKVVEVNTVIDIFANPQAEFTRQLISHSFDFTLPERLLEQLQGQVLKIVYRGLDAEESVISDAAQRFPVALNILHGKIEYIDDQALGVLLVNVKGTDETAVNGAIEYIRSRAERVEIVHG